tara:strand:+ start:56 stop:367 length:312 start_codon:yes stop_codon:yes gene_type:complete
MVSKVQNTKVNLPSVTKKAVEQKKNCKQDAMNIEVPVPVSLVAELDRVRMDVRPLSKLQRSGLVMLASALIEGEFFLENGAKVSRQSHAIKWVLEQFGKYAEK